MATNGAGGARTETERRTAIGALWPALARRAEALYFLDRLYCGESPACGRAEEQVIAAMIDRGVDYALAALEQAAGSIGKKSRSGE